MIGTLSGLTRLSKKTGSHIVKIQKLKKYEFSILTESQACELAKKTENYTHFKEIIDYWVTIS